MHCFIHVLASCISTVHLSSFFSCSMISSRIPHYIFKRHVLVHLFLVGLGCVWRLFMSGHVWCAAAYGFSLAVVSGGCSLVSASTSHCSGFPRGAQSWLTGLAAPQHVKSSQIRDRTCVPCIGRWILSHWITKEVPHYILLSSLLKFVQGPSSL